MSIYDNFMLIYDNFMLIYVNITDRRTDRQTHQKYSSEPHKTFSKFSKNRTLKLCKSP